MPEDDSGNSPLLHLSTCISCAAYMKKHEAFVAAMTPVLAERSGATPSIDLAERIIARIQQDSVETSLVRPIPFFLRSSTRRYAPLAAGFAVFLAFGLFAALVAGGILPNTGTPGFFTPTANQTDTKGASNDPNAVSQAAVSDAMEDATGFAPESCTTPKLIYTVSEVGTISSLKADSDIQSTYRTLVDSGELGDHRVFRVYQKSDGSLAVFLLLPSDTIQDRADRISKVLSTCASPFRIEIIDAEDIGDRLKTLGLVDAETFVSESADGGFRLLMLDLGR